MDELRRRQQCSVWCKIGSSSTIANDNCLPNCPKMLIDSKGYHTFFNAKRNLMAKFYDTLRLVLNCPVISKELWCLLLGNNLIAVMLVRYLEVFISICSTTNNQLNSGNGDIQKLAFFNFWPIILWKVGHVRLAAKGLWPLTSVSGKQFAKFYLTHLFIHWPYSNLGPVRWGRRHQKFARVPNPVCSQIS